MSYRPQQNDDSISELVSRMNDLNMIFKHLLESINDEDKFELWLDKCAKVDKRGLAIFIRQNEFKFTKNERAMCMQCVPAAMRPKEKIDEYLL